MGEMTAFRVKNLRALKDTDYIELKPLTILVGKNSAGKSTFARSFPLLRQTSEERKRSPVLWWGRFVDFGSFTETVRRSSDPSEIEFCFQLKVDRTTSAVRETPGQSPTQDLELDEIEASLKLVNDSAGNSSRFSKISIKRGSDVFTVEFSAIDKIGKITVNSYEWVPPEDYRHIVTYESLIPSFEFHRTRVFKTVQGNVSTTVRELPFKGRLIGYFYTNNLVYPNTSNESIWELCRQLDPADAERLLTLMQNSGAGLSTWVNAVGRMTVKDHKFIRLRELLLANQLNDLLKRVDEAIVGTISQCAYIEPVRATAERYYRKQGLAVNEVDSKGANVPFFIDSLGSIHRERFEDWLMQHLGVGIKTASDGGHLSIKLKDGAGNEANLADVGFGYSQILPVALQLWSISKMKVATRGVKRQRVPALIVIEQPELHLHPEFQAKIADLLKSAIEGGRVRLIIETHSSSIINRLGVLIATSELRREDVQIVRFDKHAAGEDTDVAISEFDENGVLMDWPYGFFDA